MAVGSWSPVVRTAVLMGLFSVSASGCAGAPPAPTQSSLVLVLEPEGAVAEVDDFVVGRSPALSKRPLVLRPGKHLLTVTAPGYFPHDMELDLRPGETRISIKLRPKPEP